MGTGSERPNLRNIASRAGVSHMTVSRVLNGHPNIKESTRRRVQAVIDELAYQPNQAARALATQRTRRIGVMIDGAMQFGPTSVLRAIETAAHTAGYNVSAVTVDEHEGVGPEDAYTYLTAQGVDALCVIAPRSSSIATLRRLAIELPLLVVKADQDPAFLTVSIDQHAGTVLAVDHLVSIGHREILHLAGPLDWLDARARERAFHRRAKEWGLRQHAIVVGDWSADFGYDYAKGFRSGPDVTAVFVANDDMAIGFLHGLHDLGIDVPGDLSVIGFDDVPLARHAIPPLTTVRQSFHALGTTVMDVLGAGIEDREIPNTTRILPELVVRESSAAPRGSR